MPEVKERDEPPPRTRPAGVGQHPRAHPALPPRASTGTGRRRAPSRCGCSPPIRIPTLARVRMVEQRRQAGAAVRRRRADGATATRTVTRRSALADLPAGRAGRQDVARGRRCRGRSVTFLPDDHIGLTKNPIFTDNVLFYLLRAAATPAYAVGRGSVLARLRHRCRRGEHAGPRVGGPGHWNPSSERRSTPIRRCGGGGKRPTLPARPRHSQHGCVYAFAPPEPPPIQNQ